MQQTNVVTTKESKLSTVFIRLWALCLTVFVLGLLYNTKHPYDVKGSDPTPPRAYLLLADLVMGVLFFLAGVRFWILEKRKYCGVISVAWKLGFVGVFLVPTMIAMIIFLDNDGSQWIIYPVFLLCVILTVATKRLVKKIFLSHKQKD